ncbi:MAG: mannose-1-phosphate guanylyltransferase [Deltaproteobacteria bacterium]|nr:mannose-1-phosphate guanylyltransferase [Deltaproteobacteria bacterium]
MTKDHPPVFAVILAGGSGTRFWPRSRKLLPKQLCKISHPDKSMLELTLERLDGFIPSDHRLIVTHALQKQKTSAIVGKKCLSILGEPLARNTAAALALAALEIKLLHPEEKEAVMISLHADHVIRDKLAFVETLKRAIVVAQKNYLALLGVIPTSPETGYGYIQKGGSLNIPQVANCFSVLSFKEKPGRTLAEQYLAERAFYWNSGLFVWKVDKILQEFEKFLPVLLNPLMTYADKLKSEGRTFSQLTDAEFLPLYENLPEIAIDHAILEKSKDIAVVECGFDWQDIGAWTALPLVIPEDAQGNVVQGDNVLLDTKNSIICSDSYLVASIGIEDLIVVVDKGCVLVCKKERAQDVKQIVSELKKRGLDKLV